MIRSRLDLELEHLFKMKKIIFVIFFFLYSINLYSETNIAYIDINFILKNSSAGKSLKNHINKLENRYLSEYKKIEENLVIKEKNLMSQKNIIDSKEFELKLKNLGSEIKTYRDDRKKSNDEMNKVKIDSTKKVLNLINPIIAKYVEKNSISIVLPKKNIIVGRKNLDITDIIVSLLDNEIQNIEFK